MKNAVYRMKHFAPLINMVLFLFLASCSKDSPTAPTITNVNGNWTGKTNQNENVSFTVSSDSVTYLRIKIVHPSGASTDMWTNPTDCTVGNNSFSMSFYGNPAVTGKFNSNNSSDGTFTSTWTNANPTTIAGTWTATKQ